MLAWHGVWYVGDVDFDLTSSFPGPVDQRAWAVHRLGGSLRCAVCGSEMTRSNGGNTSYDGRKGHQCEDGCRIPRFLRDPISLSFLFHGYILHKDVLLRLRRRAETVDLKSGEKFTRLHAVFRGLGPLCGKKDVTTNKRRAFRLGRVSPLTASLIVNRQGQVKAEGSAQTLWLPRYCATTGKMSSRFWLVYHCSNASRPLWSSVSWRGRPN